jgi:hypothetical protein
MAANKAKTKLTKEDPDFYSKIASLGGKAVLKKLGKDHFKKIAAASHPRASYNGGRPKKEPVRDGRG